jgi:hypothetical protein
MRASSIVVPALVVLAAACGSSPRPAPAPPTTASEAPAPAPPAPAPSSPAPSSPTPFRTTSFSAPEITSDATYELVRQPGTCDVRTVCGVQLIIHALGAYHVDAEYPTKFVSTNVTEPTELGLIDEETGVLLVEIPARLPSVIGTLELGVCTREVCEIKSVPLIVAR